LSLYSSFGFVFSFFLSFVFVCVFEEEEQHEEQLEEVSILQFSPCKPTMVVEVCCHRHELSIVVKVSCLHHDFLISFNF
jgi:hypothetical protein